MPIDPERTLFQGTELLKPLFSEYGFVFVQLGKGESSGGWFYSELPFEK